ncbi:Hypothetical_protein [Hexamita inflata]|uniref:Hypothetical_protein n=1 Tax=Hexamita inflata TaxID=28002 RepID=A0AA86RM90_9EUKA|nr:Hypothetical protein HINF_LOCUS64811 [Hexamita inflata]
MLSCINILSSEYQNIQLQLLNKTQLYLQMEHNTNISTSLVFNLTIKQYLFSKSISYTPNAKVQVYFSCLDSENVTCDDFLQSFKGLTAATLQISDTHNHSQFVVDLNVPNKIGRFLICILFGNIIFLCVVICLVIKCESEKRIHKTFKAQGVQLVNKVF